MFEVLNSRYAVTITFSMYDLLLYPLIVYIKQMLYIAKMMDNPFVLVSLLISSAILLSLPNKIKTD